MWNDLMSINSAPKFFDLDDSESENVASKYINEINYYLEWYSSNYNVLCDYLKKLIFQYNSFYK